LTYPSLGRTLAIRFQAAFPHVIEGWTETRRARGQTVTTTATRRAQLMTAYWGQNSPEDEALREQLGL
ncbi:MAG: septum formation inhibitor Maf, partial [Bacteroidota bacterium]